MLLFRVFLALYYVKLQDVFVSETGLDYGNFGIIGYTAPGNVTTAGSNTASAVSQTTNFEYSDTKTGYVNGTAALPAADQITWTAKARVALNDCAVNSEWRVAVKKATAAADAVTFTSSLSDVNNCQSFDTVLRQGWQVRFKLANLSKGLHSEALFMLEILLFNFQIKTYRIEYFALVKDYPTSFGHIVQALSSYLKTTSVPMQLHDVQVQIPSFLITLGTCLKTSIGAVSSVFERQN